MSVTIKIRKMHPDAVIPTYQTEGSVGADLVSVEDLDIDPGEVGVVNLGFCVAIEPGYEIQIRPRSGLAATHAVTVINTPGTIDSDYTGVVKVLLINHGNTVFKVNKGDRIAQMVVNKVEGVVWVDAEVLEKTKRGAGGFGSTGV